MIVRVMPPEHYDWIASRANLVIGDSFRAIEAVDEAGRIHGAVGYDGWTPGAVCMHVALKHPAALRHLLRPGFGIAFDAPPAGFGRGVAVATVLGTNHASLRLCRHLGFREAGRLRDGWERGVDLVFLEMRRKDCRFRNERRDV